MTDLRDAPIPAPGPGLDIGRLLGSVLPFVRMFLPVPADPLAELRALQLTLEIEKLRGRAIVPTWRPIQELAAERDDHVILGARGAGKTALAVTLATIRAVAAKQPVVAHKWPAAAAEAFGFTTGRLRRSLADCVALVDDSGYHRDASQPSRVLQRLLAVARHNDLTTIWTAQHLALLSKDLLRHDATLWFVRVDPTAARWDREEASDILTAVCAIQAGNPALRAPGSAVVLKDGAWYCTQVPMHPHYEQASKLWRHAP